MAGGSPVTVNLIESGFPTAMVIDPCGVSLTAGVSWMISVAIASTLPASFSALHLYPPASGPVTRVILRKLYYMTIRIGVCSSNSP